MIKALLFWVGRDNPLLDGRAIPRMMRGLPSFYFISATYPPRSPLPMMGQTVGAAGDQDRLQEQGIIPKLPKGLEDEVHG